MQEKECVTQDNTGRLLGLALTVIASEFTAFLRHSFKTQKEGDC
jgi:hypothetical protein